MIKKGLLVMVASMALGLSLPLSIQAATDLGTSYHINWVKVKKPIFVGEYTKVNGHRGHRVLTPKGTVLSALVCRKAKKGKPSRVMLDPELISYRRQQHISWSSTYQTSHFNTTYFKLYKLKLPIRTDQLQAGRFTLSNAKDYQPIFNITMDGYLQYYRSSKLKHYHIQSAWEYNQVMGDRNPLFTIKPSVSRKIQKFVVKKNNYYLYFHHPVDGLGMKKSHHGYRLTVKNLGKRHKVFYEKSYFYLFKWTDFQVGKQPFYYQWLFGSNDPSYFK